MRKERTPARLKYWESMKGKTKHTPQVTYEQKQILLQCYPRPRGWSILMAKELNTPIYILRNVVSGQKIDLKLAQQIADFCNKLKEQKLLEEINEAVKLYGKVR
jgi:bifunctional DNase/RNase